MTQRHHPKQNRSLSEAKEQFKNWRRTRKNPWPIPEKLLKAAVSLTATHSVRQISEELIIDYGDLKQACTKRKKGIKKRPGPTFIELDIEQTTAAVPECIIEMHNILGAKMRMHFKGNTDIDLLQLAKTFWGKQP